MTRIFLPAMCLLATASVSAAEREFVVENGALVLPGAIVFQTGGAVLSPESDPALDHIRLYLEAKPGVTLLRIEGHTDSRGGDEHNQKLSEQRAMAVALWLMGKKVDCHRLIAVGFGESKPIAPNDSPEGAALNRRITIVNAALRGRAIGGMPLDGGGQVAGDLCPL